VRLIGTDGIKVQDQNEYRRSFHIEKISINPPNMTIHLCRVYIRYVQKIICLSVSFLTYHAKQD